jgi:tetratricopeptide (TPR) repeat protein
MKKKRRASPPPLQLSRTKKWVFALVGFVLLPLLLLLGVELALRVAGYGYDPAFFKPLRIGTSDFLVENDKFGLRFFPPEIARSPPPVVMEAKKPPGVYRIFVLGESAALGDPRPAYGAARYLQMLLRERYPGTKFEVICGAVTAINSHAVLPIARECARHEGDLWIIYMGNNEMIGPFGATTIFGSQSPPLAYVRLSLAIQRTRLGQWLTSLGRRLNAQHRSAWGGMKMFLENQIGAQDKRKDVVYSSFQRNLEDMLRSARQTGVPVILSTVAVNLKDCAPLASLDNTNMAASDQALYDKAVTAGITAEGQGQFAEAAQQYEQAAKLNPFSAEIQFHWARCLLADTNAAGALEHFEKARDYDALPFRADSRINHMILEAGARNAEPGLALSDAVSLVASNSPGLIAGKEWFYEHVHFNFDGNYRLARAWADQVARFLPATISQAAKADWATQEACERALGLTDWNRYSVLEDMLGRLAQAPFPAQANHKEQMEGLKAQIQELRQRMDPPSAAKARQIYQDALHAAPDDHRLHENYAEFLDLLGDLQGALSEWKQVSELIPQHHLAYFQSGRLLRRMGKLDDATKWLEKAVTMRPDLGEGWLELGNIHAAQGAYALALTEYDRAQALSPQDYRVYYHMGKSLSKLHQSDQAIQAFRQSIKLRPTNWEAHYALGEEFAFSGQTVEARSEFRTAVQEKPDYALAHLNLGVSLIRLGDSEGALREFEETQRLDPQNQMAREYINRVRLATKQK